MIYGPAFFTARNIANIQLFRYSQPIEYIQVALRGRAAAIKLAQLFFGDLMPAAGETLPVYLVKMPGMVIHVIHAGILIPFRQQLLLDVRVLL